MLTDIHPYELKLRLDRYCARIRNPGKRAYAEYLAAGGSADGTPYARFGIGIMAAQCVEWKIADIRAGRSKG